MFQKCDLLWSLVSKWKTLLKLFLSSYCYVPKEDGMYYQGFPPSGPSFFFLHCCYQTRGTKAWNSGVDCQFEEELPSILWLPISTMEHYGLAHALPWTLLFLILIICLHHVLFLLRSLLEILGIICFCMFVWDDVPVMLL